MESSNIIATEEIFRVNYFEDLYEKLMKQSYTDGPPFYYRVKCEKHFEQVPVETSSSEISDIVKYYERAIKIDRSSFSKSKSNAEVKKVYEHCLNKDIEFLKKLKTYQEAEQPESILK